MKRRQQPKLVLERCSSPHEGELYLDFGARGRFVVPLGKRICLLSLDINDAMCEPSANHLGSGAGGVVVEMTVGGSVCAVKMISRSRGSEVWQSLMRELVASSKLAVQPSAYVVAPTSAAFMEYSGSHCVILEMAMQSSNAKMLLASARANLGSSLAFVEKVVCPLLLHDILQSLRHLHEVVGLCHNDVKLENILLSYDETGFVLADFGCSVETKHLNCVEMIRDVCPLGVMTSRPPERDVACVVSVDGKLQGTIPVCSTKSDVWSLGEMLVEGFHCVRGKRVQDTINCRKRYSRRVRRLLGGMPPNSELKRIVSLCLASNVHDRPTVSELLGDTWIKSIEADLCSLRAQLKGFATGVRVDSGRLSTCYARNFLHEIYQSTSHTCDDEFPHSPVASMLARERLLRFRHVSQMRTTMTTAVSLTQFKHFQANHFRKKFNV